ncbi:outer membrane protein assembly factor BamC [Crenothrix polyspora]|uniref:Outer membrane protein assembly factor BamC n=1 Tax=Crenothrix polyspora TaxID=360316 RepID=A0A1R4HBQ0_9GAMM|nr:outer membrane protein assembly factor BamC [Crenothrix polyspora]SJM93300.1 conserved exported hypothetical protein [Crenothrix polyspora]
MNYTHCFLKSLLLAVIFALVACGSVNDRYADNDMLERPPEMLPSTSEPEPVAQEEVRKKAVKGLGDDINVNNGGSVQLKLKRSFDIAWHDLELILKHKEIEIKDREHDKGQYYVIFDADDYQAEDSGFFDKSKAFFNNDYKPVVYIVTVEADGDSEARISAALANDTEQTTSNDKDDHLTDGADKLSLYLYKSLRDDLVED